MKSKLKKGFERLVRLLGRTEGLVFRLSWTTVNRDCFLQHTLGSYLSPSQMQQAITGSPLDVLTPEKLRHFARKVIWEQSLLVSFFSVLLALPSERFSLVAVGSHRHRPIPGAGVHSGTETALLVWQS
jgi:hypothetical protein